MEGLLRQLYQDKASEPETLGILIIEKEANAEKTIINPFDVILLIIKAKGSSPCWSIKHYELLNIQVSMNIVEETQLYHWMITGNNQRFIDWVFNGKIVFDRNEYVQRMKTNMRDFPFEERQKKIGVEFAKLIRRFEKGKSLYQTQNYLDAFNNILHALHHQARLSVIEHGFFPEVTVWEQVKQIEPETYKLYHELIIGDESIEKRVELLMIANEFAITSKTSLGSMHLKKVMNKRTDAWSIAELMEEEELVDYAIDLERYLEFLVRKNMIEIETSETKAEGIYHRRYKMKEAE